MKASEAIEGAADLISRRGAWCQIDYAQDRYGRAVSADDPNAVSWCAYGAVQKIGGMDARIVLGNITGFTIGAINDAPGQRKRTVVAKLREAAAKARDQGQ